MAPFCYGSLPDGKSIRMLTLNPGEYDSTLEGSLRNFDIASTSSNDYEPISYVWGSPERTHSILCNGKDLPITASLFDALRRLRHKDRSRILWVDQISINQNDVVERSQQVQFMNKIYANANHVLVWLGPDEQMMAKSAFERIQDLHSILEDNNAGKQRLQSLSEEAWIHVKHMTTLPWFRRAWIVQEIGTPAEATLFWGDEEIDWKIVHRVCDKLTDSHHLRKKLNIRTDLIKYAFQRFVAPERTSRHANRFSLMYELHRARHLEVTDERDRVFAMLGHYSVKAPNAQLASLRAHYDKTLEEVYCDVATRALRGDDSLITLAAVQHLDLAAATDGQHNASNRGRVVTQHTLPSWVPNWNTYQTHILSEPISPHRAHGTTLPKVEIDSTNLILHIHGLRLDRVVACSEPLAEREFHLGDSARVQAVQTLWHDVCGLGAFDLKEKYANGESAVFAYLQTLSNGGASTASRDPRPYHEIPNDEWLAQGTSYLVQAVSAEHSLAPEPLLSDLEAAAREGEHSKWSRAANGASKNRKFARTEKGYHVLGPKVMEVGDVVCVLFGGKMPFCLRPCGDAYLLVGECYVHGVMNGEALELMKSGKLREDDFLLV